MAAIHVVHDDPRFLAWLKRHPNGYVLNTNLKPSREYMILHSALCSEWKREYNSEEPFTGQGYSKVVAKSVRELQEWVMKNGRPEGTFTGTGCRCLRGHNLFIGEALRPRDGEAWEPDTEEHWNTNFVGGSTDTRELAFLAVRMRRGQAAFRNALINAYGPKCMVTGCRVLAVIEAAHIKSYRGIEDHHVQNGLLLRADIHTLFDLNLLGIRPDTLEVAVHQTLAGSTYQKLAGRRLRLSNGNVPALAALTERWEEFEAAGEGE